MSQIANNARSTITRNDCNANNTFLLFALGPNCKLFRVWCEFRNNCLCLTSTMHAWSGTFICLKIVSRVHFNLLETSSIAFVIMIEFVFLLEAVFVNVNIIKALRFVNTRCGREELVVGISWHRHRHQNMQHICFTIFGKNWTHCIYKWKWWK